MRCCYAVFLGFYFLCACYEVLTYLLYDRIEFLYASTHLLYYRVIRCLLFYFLRVSLIFSYPERHLLLRLFHFYFQTYWILTLLVFIFLVRWLLLRNAVAQSITCLCHHYIVTKIITYSYIKDVFFFIRTCLNTSFLICKSFRSRFVFRKP